MAVALGHSALMLWLVAGVVLAVLAAIPFLSSAADAGRRARLGKRVILGVWVLCALAMVGYVSISKIAGCWREDSVLGRESWSAIPFGQVCSFDPTERRAAEIMRPGWTPTVCLAVVLAGAVVLVSRASTRRRRGA